MTQIPNKQFCFSLSMPRIVTYKMVPNPSEYLSSFLPLSREAGSQFRLPVLHLVTIS